MYLINGERGSVGSLIMQYFTEIKSLNLSEKSEAKVLLHLASSTKKEKLFYSNIVYLKKVVLYCQENSIKNLVFFGNILSVKCI